MIVLTIHNIEQRIYKQKFLRRAERSKEMNVKERNTTTARNWFYFSSFYAILLWNFVIRILQLRQQNA